MGRWIKRLEELRQMTVDNAPVGASPDVDLDIASPSRLVPVDAAPNEPAQDDPELAWRIEALRAQHIPPTGGIVLRALRAGAPVDANQQGRCSLCDDVLAAGRQYRCGACVQAVERVLNEVREGVPALPVVATEAPVAPTPPAATTPPTATPAPVQPTLRQPYRDDDGRVA